MIGVPLGLFAATSAAGRTLISRMTDAMLATRS
jgi:hypothetical protein